MKRAALLGCALAFAACSGSGSGSKSKPEPEKPAPEDAAVAATPTDGAVAMTLHPALPIPGAPRGLPRIKSVDYNVATAEKRDLGSVLFFDARLSRDGSMSCATCHDPDNEFAGTVALPTTVDGKVNLRHAPTLRNVGYHLNLFQDGRADSLEAAIEANWAGQMGADPDRIADTLARHPRYAALFRRAFSEPPTGRHIVAALATYVRYLRSGDAPLDRYEAGLSDSGMSAEAIAGALVFNGRARCAQCHPPPLYTDRSFHVVGSSGDLGRGRITGEAADNYAFRTTSLRGAANRTHYLHDGSATDLARVIDAHLAQTTATPDQPAVTLTAEQRANLFAFVRALSPAKVPYTRPRTIQ